MRLKKNCAITTMKHQVGSPYFCTKSMKSNELGGQKMKHCKSEELAMKFGKSKAKVQHVKLKLASALEVTKFTSQEARQDKQQ